MGKAHVHVGHDSPVPANPENQTWVIEVGNRLPAIPGVVLDARVRRRRLNADGTDFRENMDIAYPRLNDANLRHSPIFRGWENLNRQPENKHE
jgi:hypothetical protein